MAAPPYMKLWVADYLADTTHLSRSEHGAYMLLLMAMWRAGGKLPADDARLAKITLSTPKEWGSMRGALLGFFQRRGSMLTHKRVAKEIAKYTTTSERRKEAGKVGGSKTANKNKDKAIAIATANIQQLPTKPEPEPKKDKDADASSVGPDDPTAGDLTGPVEGTPGAPWDRDPLFGELWSSATAQMRARAKSKTKTWPEWLKAKRRTEPRLIVDAMKPYLAGDPDVVRTGGPGLHLWLRDGTYDLWLAVNADIAAAPSWLGPPDVYALVERQRDAAWAARYLGYFRWSEVPRALLTSSPSAADVLQREIGPALAADSIQIIVEKAA